MHQFFEKYVILPLRAVMHRMSTHGSDELRRERGQAILRTLLGVAIGSYLVGIYPGKIALDSPPIWLVVIAICTAASAVVTLLLYRETDSSATRRTWINLADVLAITYSVIVAGEYATPLFVLYLWVTLGNGFRFGARAMTVSAVLSVLGLVAVLVLLPSSYSLTSVAGAVFVALILLPLYLSRFIGRGQMRAPVAQGENKKGVTGAELRSVLANIKKFILLRCFGRSHDELGREQGQAVSRAVISGAMLFYLSISHYPFADRMFPPEWFSFLVGYIIFSIALVALTRRDYESRRIRRLIANVGDVAAISYVLIAAGTAAIPAFVLYLWVTLGNGFRFGLGAMVISAALSLAGFSAVLVISPAWNELATIAAVVMASLILMPAYSANLLSDRIMGDALHFGKAERAVRELSHSLVRERGQAFTRLAVCTVVFIYLLARYYPLHSLEPWLLFCIGFLGLSALFVVLLRLYPKESVARRALANLADTSAISYVMATTGDAGLPLFILYLWVTLGNGFRFGLSAMVLSTALSVVGFSIVIFASNLWQAQSTLAASILLGLILIPGYAAYLIQQLHEARKRAEEASAAKGHFLARMSHELRTPLNGILGTAELLAASKRFTKEDRSMLDVIKESVNVSMQQIDNVLDFSKIEAGKLTIEQIDFDLHELMTRAVRIVRNIAIEKGLRINLMVDPEVPYQVVGDPHHLHEVLLNLLSNAVKFTEKGYVTLEAHLVAKSQASATVRLEVHDTGVGIEPDALERIFEAFTQADTGTTRRYGGTGLGTTIAKQLIELMGGRLVVSSVKGQGSTFYAELRFPLKLQESPNKISEQLTGIRLLLVSKNSDLQRRVDIQVHQWGATLATVESVQQAVGLLGRSIRLGNPIHVALIDSQAAFTGIGAHSADDFLKKAGLSSTPVFLIGDVIPQEEQLRQWGYAGALPYQLTHQSLFNALHVGITDSNARQGVVQVEPWVWGQSSHPRMPVLIADDNRTNLMILEKMLKAANYEVDTAQDGEQALEKLLAGRYKVAILDMHMPGLDGMAVIKQYRMIRNKARIPIVMLTANATMDAVLESAEAGADAYLTKPTTAAAVLGTIKKLLDETEIYDLGRNQRLVPAAQEVPLLDTAVLAEIDRLCNDPRAMTSILDTFESEGRQALDKLAIAINDKNHAVFCDLLHALKGNGANVGACRLVQACHEIQGCGVIEFRRDGKQMLLRLKGEFLQATQALRELTAAGGPGSARG